MYLMEEGECKKSDRAVQILLVTDMAWQDEEIEELEELLEERGAVLQKYLVDYRRHTYDGEVLHILETGIEAFNSAVLLRLHRPEKGLVLVEQIRSVAACPLLVLTETMDAYQQIRYLETGADDVVDAGQHPEVLWARLMRLCHLYQGYIYDAHTWHGWSERMASGEICWNEAALALSGKEQQVMHWLLHARGRVVPRETLLALVWGEDYTGDPRTLDTTVKQIRYKLKPTGWKIRSVYGKGYRLADDEEVM